ncbi:hypothetical protein BH10BAC5_BH10BAC5_13310 [soil metagenome]
MKFKTILFAFGIPVLFAVVIYRVFETDKWRDIYQVMTVTFVFFLPFTAGALTVFLSPKKLAESIPYRIFAPWVPIMFFFMLTIAISWEGWVCWMMMLPFFLFIATLGGLYSGYLKKRISSMNEKLNISLLILLPFLLSPVEQMIKTITGTYEAYTEIEINSSAEKIWGNVTRVGEIKQEQDKGKLTEFMGFPRPIKAELNFEGIGATREAIFSKGLVFHETVLSYEDKKKMVFTIKANPYDIPSTTMDEHIVIGGDYFDVLDGTYELEKLDKNKYRLHLYSHFVLSTNFNFYASWWGKWIMKDIQNNILHVIKERAEHE